MSTDNEWWTWIVIGTIFLLTTPATYIPVAMVLLPLREGEHENSLSGYLAPLRQTLIDNNERHVNVVCESDYRALRRGIEHLLSGVQ